MFRFFPTNYVWDLSINLAIEMGARMGEIQAMCAPLTEAARQPDAAGTTAFRETWVRMANQLSELAAEDEARGRLISAGDKLNRAATYLITAERLLAHGSEGRLALYQQFLQTFRRGVELTGENCEFVRIPYEGQHLSGLFVRAHGDERPRGPAGLAGATRRGLADHRSTRHGRCPAPAGPHRPLRQRALGQPRGGLAGNPPRHRPPAHRP